jgi:CrcB protein
LQKYLLIAAGGALGSIARYWVGSTIAGRMGTRFPYGTFVINITACIVIGFSLTYLGKRTGMDPAWRFLIAVGFIGAIALAGLYAVGSLILGLTATWLGALLAEAI